MDRIDGVPVAGVVRAGSAGEVAERLREARAAGRALVPVGGGTKLHLGNRPAARSVWRLELGALAGPPELEPDEGIVTAEAGVRVEALRDAARGAGMGFRVEPLHREATLGGTVAVDPPGPERAPGRRLRDDLLGLEVALANGKLARCGGRVVKNVTGFDLVRLYCGSLGTLGVITKVTLRLRALPEAQRVLVRSFASLEQALGTAAELQGSPAQPDGMGLRAKGNALRLVWRLEGSADDVSARAEETGGEAAPGEEWEDLQRAVRGAPGEGIALRLGARPSDTLELCQALRGAGGARALRAALPACGIALADVPLDALDPVLKLAGERRWAFVLERAPDAVKAGYDVFGPLPASIGVMRALKDRFDPDRTLSPGRFLGRI